MGWLGWTPDRALAFEAAHVEAALASRTDLISMVFGDGKPSNKSAGKVTAAKFRAFATAHNRRLANDE